MEKLKRHAQFETHDVSHACEHLGELLHRRVEISNHRRFHCAVATAELRVISVNWLEFGGDLKITTQADEILYLLVRLEEGTVDRREGEDTAMMIRPWTGILVPPRSSAVAEIAGGLKATVICMPVKAVQLEAERLVGMQVKQPMELVQISNFGPESYIGQRIDFMLEQLDLPEGLFTKYPLLGFEFQRGLIRTVIEYLPNSYFGLLAKHHGAARQHVKLLKQFLMQNLRNAAIIGLPAMAKAVGASEGTLRRHCKRECGQTPEELYASLRIHAAHERLENTLLVDTVTSIAREFGFTNEKRFKDLHEKFFHGETPKETRQRGLRKLGLAPGGTP